MKNLFLFDPLLIVISLCSCKNPPCPPVKPHNVIDSSSGSFLHFGFATVLLNNHSMPVHEAQKKVNI